MVWNFSRTRSVHRALLAYAGKSWGAARRPTGCLRYGGELLWSRIVPFVLKNYLNAIVLTLRFEIKIEMDSLSRYLDIISRRHLTDDP